MSQWMIFRTIFRQQYYSGCHNGVNTLPGGSLTFVAVDSRDAGSCSCSELLFRTRDCCSIPACAVHFVGRFRCLADTLAADSSLAACRFSYLGNPDGAASLAVSVDRA